MRSATIVREKKDPSRIYIRIDKGAPQTGGDIEVIEVLQQKDGESLEDFKERCVRFVKERVS